MCLPTLCLRLPGLRGLELRSPGRYPKYQPWVREQAQRDSEKDDDDETARTRRVQGSGYSNDRSQRLDSGPKVMLWMMKNLLPLYTQVML